MGKQFINSLEENQRSTYPKVLHLPKLSTASLTTELGWDEEENQASLRPLVSLARRNSQGLSALLPLSQPELGRKKSES